MPVTEKNYWLETVLPGPSTPPQALPDSTDVAVVGAGFCGLSAARRLAQRGTRVVLLEAETAGWGASSRNGGMVLGGLKLPVPVLLGRYGRETVRKMYAASLESIACVEQIVKEEKIDCDFTRCGHLEVAVKPSHFDAFARSAGLIAREFGHALEIVPRSELHREIGSRIYYGGLVDPASAGLNPARYVAGLARAARSAGVSIHEQTRVTAIRREAVGSGARFLLQTTRGGLAAREVVLGTGAYTGAATPALRRKIIPIGSYLIATEPLPADLAAELSPRNRMIYDSKHFLYYYRLTPDRRMLFGGRAAFFPETDSTVRRSAELLRRGMLGVYPQLRDVRVDYVWGGTLDFTFDVMPHAGKIEQMHYALGFAGHGVAAATWSGFQLAGRILGEPGDNPFEGIRFRSAPIGLRSGRSWALPLAGAWYRLLDLFT